MIRLAEIEDLEQIYHYQLQFSSPYFFPVDYGTWEESFLHDIDGEGSTLFKELCVKGAYDDGELIGFIQYGKTAFGFNDQGAISSDISHCIIRNLYFDEKRADVGQLLLKEAMDSFPSSETVYAFFHYFGMSCFARHGKLFERYDYIENLLKENGFAVEHENVYYSSALGCDETSEVELHLHALTKGNQQYMDFVLSGNQVGGCEMHFLDDKTAYLRWIYVNDTLTGKGIGTQCMSAVKRWLYQKGITRLDTDTAVSNMVAQHYYEKNRFTRQGITRSYYRT